MAISRRAPYVLDNGEPTAWAMQDHLSAVLDDFTQRRLTEAGVGPGDICWEIGAGNGSVATWLGDRVGDTGQVFATDITARHIRAHPRVLPLAHDVSSDPPPTPTVDVAHARLVFAHLPDPRDTLAKVAGVVVAGGVLVIEDWGQWSGPLLTSPIKGAAGVYARYQAALWEVLRSFGSDAAWAGGTAHAMTEVGVVDVDVRVEARSWPGGTPGCLWPVVVSTHLREPLLGCGATAADLDALAEIMNHPDTLVLGNVTVSTIGHRCA